MIVVIDGYNLIKQVLGLSRVSHVQRDEFVNELINYTRKKGHFCVIVFDGGSFSYPYKTVHQHTTILFSGYKEKADALIMRFIDEHLGDELLIVSSDREIRDHARTKQKVSMPADQFYYQHVRISNKKSEKLRTPFYKQACDAPPELDELMLMASEQVPAKDDDAHLSNSTRKRNAQRPSKKERQLLKIVRKL